MCRFNPNVTRDEDNYEVVAENMIELCEKGAGQLDERSHPVIKDAQDASPPVGPTRISTMPSVPREALPFPSLASNRCEDDHGLTRRLHQLRQ